MRHRDIATTVASRTTYDDAECHYVVAWLPVPASGAEALAGWIGIVASRLAITRLVLPQTSLAEVMEQLRPSRSLHLAWNPLLGRAYRQICAYLAGRRQGFTVPVDLRHATPFVAGSAAHATHSTGADLQLRGPCASHRTRRCRSRSRPGDGCESRTAARTVSSRRRR